MGLRHKEREKKRNLSIIFGQDLFQWLFYKLTSWWKDKVVKIPLNFQLSSYFVRSLTTGKGGGARENYNHTTPNISLTILLFS